MRIWWLAVILSLALLHPVFADGTIVHIEQIGDGHSIELAQKHDVFGDFANEAIIKQAGASHTAKIDQSVSSYGSNKSSVQQDGTSNLADITQQSFMANHNAFARQDGLNNVATIFQGDIGGMNIASSEWATSTQCA
jgi:hypothetical protein